MFRFEYTDHLFAFAIIPVLVVLFVVMWIMRRKAIELLGDSALLSRLMPQVSKYKHIVKFVLTALALCILIIAWANPQWGSKQEKVKRKSADVFIALDISRSMLAEDIRPNRLERAKQFAVTLIDELKGERLGLIIFAGNAYLQMPLTTDYKAAQLFIKSANTEMAPTQGTAIGEVIDLAERCFEENNKHHKALVIITDGENHDKEAIERMRYANGNGLLGFTVGVGTEQGGFMPIVVRGRTDYKRGNNGEPIRTVINEEMMRDIASAGQGNYFNLLQGEEVASSLRQKIDRIEKRELEQRSFSEYESYFQYFIALALLLILIEFFITYGKSKWLEGKDLFKQ